MQYKYDFFCDMQPLGSLWKAKNDCEGAIFLVVLYNDYLQLYSTIVQQNDALPQTYFMFDNETKVSNCK